MARELARANESTTSPKHTKDHLGDEDGFDGRRAPDASHRHQGALARLKRSGVAAYLSLPPRCVGDLRGDNPARLMRCPEAARLKWTARNQVRLRNCRPIRDRKGPGAIRPADVLGSPRKRCLRLIRMGTRCWSGGGREALPQP